ncbi:unnamed protein product [Cuscuta epithymum]|uniref:FAD-dependent oxidoreductase domain-containing protein 1 n=1 Tax=Cuscuta epithymum TaxID=186058 RepID=A0AAV0DU42_9ASTE|nr:unnamed protein product [Cuscuta epithymum]CAH9129361.1 unnamed protein product [Cuscuta epithymum]
MAANSLNHMPSLVLNRVEFSHPINTIRPPLLPPHSRPGVRKLAGYGPPSYSTAVRKSRSNECAPLRVSELNQTSFSGSFDVVIIGSGIIGLSIARQFLLGSDLSVAVIDAAVPCSGATGAGQGYLWKVHKSPDTDKWELAERSHQLWVDLAKNIEFEGTDPSEILGWKKTGSLLVGRTSEESSILRRKVEKLCDAGMRAEFLTSSDLLSEEPALVLEKEGGAAYAPDDCQFDARRAVAFIEKGNRQFASEGRYAEFYHEPATSLLRSGNHREVEAVQTSKNILHSKKAVILAAGCWSGSLMHELIKHHDIELDLPIKPRKGHLLVIDNFKPFKLNHGLMEAGYVNHESLKSAPNSASAHTVQTTSVSMTATMNMSGGLILGSSRQLVGFNNEVDESIIKRIWEQAGEFFPMLRKESLEELRQNSEVRVGLRPYCTDGKPVIGPVPGLSNLFVAAGHEGEGLSLAPGTAEMIVDMVMGSPGKVDPAPFAVRGRFC